MWNSETGDLAAILEAFALGQMRTGGMSGVATRWMAAPDSDVLALIGTGRQAITQTAAVAAVRHLRQVRVFSPTPEKRRAFVADLRDRGFGFEVVESDSAAGAADGAHIVTLVTRARDPFFTSAMAMRGAHINAVGAITPEREELTQDVLLRIGLVAADDPVAMRKLSKEFVTAFGQDDAAWQRVRPISQLVHAGQVRAADCDLSVFKAMGMGISDMALGIEILRRAREHKLGKPIDTPKKASPRLR
jgi:ornithine cyclodeaminase